MSSARKTSNSPTIGYDFWSDWNVESKGFSAGDAPIRGLLREHLAQEDVVEDAIGAAFEGFSIH